MAKSILIFAMIVLCSSLQAQNTLYYSDGGRNVVRVSIDASGKPLGKSAKLTTTGGCDRFSISPDEKKVVGLGVVSRAIDKESDTALVSWKLFVEEPGKKSSRRVLGTTEPAAGMPCVLWSPKGAYFLLATGVTDRKVSVYEFSTGKKIVDSSKMPASISPDERFLVSEQKYPLKPSATNVTDLVTGKSVEISEGQCPVVWAGSSDKLAWIDSGNLYTAALSAGPTELSLAWREKVSSAAYDLRWVPEKGVYFVMGSSRTRELGCYSENLKTIVQGDMLPDSPDRWQAAIAVKAKKGTLPEEASYSPDGALIAYTVPSGKQGETKLFVLDASGKLITIGPGRSPLWRGSESLWNPWRPGW